MLDTIAEMYGWWEDCNQEEVAMLILEKFMLLEEIATANDVDIIELIKGAKEQGLL